VVRLAACELRAGRCEAAVAGAAQAWRAAAGLQRQHGLRPPNPVAVVEGGPDVGWTPGLQPLLG